MAAHVQASRAKGLAKLAAALLLCCALSSHAGQGAAEYVNAYLDLWLQEHQFKAYRKSSAGIVFDTDGSVLEGDIHQVNELKPGSLYSAETRITLTFKDGRKLEDFVAGAGSDPRASVMDALQNFCVTTLHPIHAARWSPMDPHVRRDRWTIGGTTRQLFLSDWGLRMAPIDAATQKAIEAGIAAALKQRPLSDEMHWIKLVIAGEQGKATQLVLTVDGRTDEATTAALRDKAFVLPEDFFMGKLFFVVAKR
jgi:hypothetical protein